MADDTQDLRELSTHFAFGRNWADFAEVIDEERIVAAEAALRRLLGRDRLDGCSFLDVGCGSGLHSLAALRLGAARVVATDIDPDSVATASALLGRRAADRDWVVREVSVFDLDPTKIGTFDVVYSWGVLHHTGDLAAALEQAARLVAPGALLAIAIYRRTPACGAWRVIKRAYAHGPAWTQALLANVYKAVYLLGLAASGRNPLAHVRGFRQKRGMSWSHDVHDWLGGYPYESASPAELHAFFAAHGFRLAREFLHPVRAAGLLGSGNNEYAFVRAG